MTDSLQKFPLNFHRLSLNHRREILENCFDNKFSMNSLGDEESVSLADILVENAVGVIPVPLALATGFRIDSEDFIIPFATEEASVVAAASFAAKLLSSEEGITTSAGESISTVQVFIEGATKNSKDLISKAEPDIQLLADESVKSLVSRGGGYRSFSIVEMPEIKVLKVEINVDVCDAMGANKVNTVGHNLKNFLEKLTNGHVLMSIVNNASAGSLVFASGKVRISKLKTLSYSGDQVANRIIRAVRVANFDIGRAVTHNKGVLNGISALALATGNDTRAIEAAAHGWAARNGHYKSLTKYKVKGDVLHAEIECPLPLGVVGGAIDLAPISSLSLQVLRYPSSRRLASIAAAVGLAQNLAALRALVSEGIQKGHMRLHAKRVAFIAGARGKDLQVVSENLALGKKIDVTTAQEILNSLKD